ncbi:Alpha/Beta hydrolase protein [Panaeolus papilionaceus]|nr:Alpha/Beta hydrolase protein [Panaeolus papilionaceus]
MAVAPVLKYLTVPATTKHTATVIFIHGLGDTGHGWRPIADMFKVDPALAHVKWVLPHSYAPSPRFLPRISDTISPVSSCLVDHKLHLPLVSFISISTSCSHHKVLFVPSRPTWVYLCRHGESPQLSSIPHSIISQVHTLTAIITSYRFDIYSFGFNTNEDEDGMRKSAGLLHDLIKYEIESNGIDPSRIVIGGFSQGGTMSLLTGLTGDFAFAGVACLSGWLPIRNKFKEIASPHAVSTNVFYGHGSADPLVRMQQFEDSAKNLVDLGIPRSTNGEFGGLYYHVYEGMGHCTVQKELDDLKRFIEKCIPADTSK